jgi:hypothetical protein
LLLLFDLGQWMGLNASVSFAPIKNQKHETEKEKYLEMVPFGDRWPSYFGISKYETGIDATVS